MIRTILKPRTHGPARKVGVLVGVAAVGLVAAVTTTSSAVEFSWNAGNGSWYNASNWTPNGDPDSNDDVRIGNLPGAQDSTVLLGSGNLTEIVGSLELTDGMTLDTNFTEFGTFGIVEISGANSRMIVRPQALGPNQHDFTGLLHVGAGAHFEMHDDVPVRFFSGDGSDANHSYSFGVISGRGQIEIQGTGEFRNDGVIAPDNNGGIVISQDNLFTGPGDIDLDGTTGGGQLLLTTPFSTLEISASSLTDTFSGDVFMVPGALLTMNIADGWATASNSSINVTGSNNPAAASQIAGSELTMGGMLNVGGAQGHLRVLAPASIAQNGVVNVGNTDWLEFDGATTVLGGQFELSQGARLDFAGPTTLEDGQFTLDEDADLEFHGATTVLGGHFGMGEGAGLGFYGDTIIRGGDFTTASNSINDGLVIFSGSTEWDGNVTISGVARQVADAVVTGATVIDAGLLDMDGGDGNTIWTIQASTVINADRIDSSEPREFNGTLNIGSGFFGQLTININDPVPQWTMAGEMNLNGVAAAAFFLNRVGGSHLRLIGDLNISHRVRITSDATFGDGSTTSFADSATALQMTGQSLIFAGATFNGDGTLDNGAAGEMTLADGASLGQVGLVNRGLLEVGDSPGIASVDRFTNLATGAWRVEIGGYVLGDEFDHLLVTGDAATLDGLLDVRLVDAGNGLFLPHLGDEFTILSALGGVTGQFLNNPVSHAAGQQFHWSVLYHPNDVTLVLSSIVVPEPTTAMLAVCGLIGLTIPRRKVERELRPRTAAG